jgi:hypothetical protein
LRLAGVFIAYIAIIFILHIALIECLMSAQSQAHRKSLIYAFATPFKKLVAKKSVD